MEGFKHILIFTHDPCKQKTQQTDDHNPHSKYQCFFFFVFAIPVSLSGAAVGAGPGSGHRT